MSQTFRNSKPVVEESKDQCPYDPAHWISKDVMLKHLVRCKKSLLNQPTSPYYSKALDLKECRWSSLHRIPSKQLDDHERTCPDQKAFLKNHFQDRMSHATPPTGAKVFVPDNPVPDEENWDNDPVEGGGYDPMQKIENDANLIYNKQGMSKAQRRNYTLERRRQANEQREYGSGGWSLLTQRKEDSGRSATQPLSSHNSDDCWWSASSRQTKAVGRGRGSKVQDTTALSDMVVSMASALPPGVVPVGRGRGRGAPGAAGVGPPPGYH